MVDLGLCMHCNNSCIMCTTVRTADIKNAKQVDLSKKEILNFVNKLNIDTDVLGLTGGEPTIRNDLPELLSFMVKKLPNTEIKLLTNGRLFAYSDFTKKVINTGLKMFIIPIHAHAYELHDFITRTPKSFEQTILGIKNLLKYDVDIEIRVVIHAINYPYLPKIAEFIKNNLQGISRVVFLYFDAIGSGSINKNRLFVKMIEVVPYLEKAVDILNQNDIKTFIYHFPLCVLKKKYWNIAKGRTVEERRITFCDTCKKCKLKEECPGIWKTYAFNMSTSEFGFSKGYNE